MSPAVSVQRRSIWVLRLGRSCSRFRNRQDSCFYQVCDGYHLVPYNLGENRVLRRLQLDACRQHGDEFQKLVGELWRPAETIDPVKRRRPTFVTRSPTPIIEPLVENPQSTDVVLPNLARYRPHGAGADPERGRLLIVDNLIRHLLRRIRDSYEYSWSDSLRVAVQLVPLPLVRRMRLGRRVELIFL